MLKIHMNSRFSFVFTDNFLFQCKYTGIKKNRQNSLFLWILHGGLKAVYIKQNFWHKLVFRSNIQMKCNTFVHSVLFVLLLGFFRECGFK